MQKGCSWSLQLMRFLQLSPSLTLERNNSCCCTTQAGSAKKDLRSRYMNAHCFQDRKLPLIGSQRLKLPTPFSGGSRRLAPAAKRHALSSRGSRFFTGTPAMSATPRSSPGLARESGDRTRRSEYSRLQVLTQPVIVGNLAVLEADLSVLEPARVTVYFEQQTGHRLKA